MSRRDRGPVPKHSALAVLMGILLVVTAACASETAESSVTTSTAATSSPSAEPSSTEPVGDGGTAEDGEGVTFVRAVSSAATNLDQPTWEGTGSRQFKSDQNSKLVELDVGALDGLACGELPQAGSIRGELAESWTEDRDSNTIRVELRRGVLSNFGNELTSEDVKWSLERGIDLSGIVNNLLFRYTSYKPSPDTVTIIDDYTLDLNFESINSLSMAMLAMEWPQIWDSKTVLEHATEDDPWGQEFLATQTADFGPWQVEAGNFTSGQQVIYTVNPNWKAYAEPRGNIDRYIVRTVSDPGARYQLLATGEADMADAVTTDQIVDLQDNPEVVVKECSRAERIAFFLNFSRDEFQDVRVRQAISLAINRETLAEGVYRGFALPATSGLSSAHAHTQPNPSIHLDADRARELLEEAGYGEGLTFSVAISPGEPGPQIEQVALSVQSDLAAVGIQMDIEVVESGAEFSEGIEGQTYAGYIWGVDPTFEEPSFELALHHVSTAGRNFHGYSNPEYDEVVAVALNSDDESARQAAIDRAAQIIVDDVPAIYLLDVQGIVTMRSDVDGVYGPTTRKIGAHNITIDR